MDCCTREANWNSGPFEPPSKQATRNHQGAGADPPDDESTGSAALFEQLKRLERNAVLLLHAIAMMRLTNDSRIVTRNTHARGKKEWPFVPQLMKKKRRGA